MSGRGPNAPVFHQRGTTEEKLEEIREELKMNRIWHREDVETLETFRRRLHAMERLVAATQRQLAAQGRAER